MIDTFREALPGWRLVYTELDEPGVCDPDTQTVWIDIRLPRDERHEALRIEIAHVNSLLHPRMLRAVPPLPTLTTPAVLGVLNIAPAAGT